MRVTIPESVLAILSAMEFDGNVARITGGQLDRPLYLQVNKALDALGGKWSRISRGHVFDTDAAERIEEAILTGTYDRMKDGRMAFDFFPTPRPLADAAVSLAQITYGMSVLEPSAGDGSLAMRCAEDAGHGNVDTVELRGDLIDTLRRKALDPLHSDFLKIAPNWFASPFHRVVMNPPFSRRQDIAHIRHAFQFLRPGGRLVAIASAGVAFRDDRAAREFRDFVAGHGGSITANPEGSFRESGTNVNTVTVVVERAA